MQTRFPKPFLVSILLIGFGFMGTSATLAQTLTTLRSFTAADGTYPSAELVLAADRLYGTTTAGGTWSNGTVFALNTDGTGFTNLHSFSASYSLNNVTNSDGESPYAGLVLSGSTLYGTTDYGGTNGNGTLFAVNTDGTGFTILYTCFGAAGSLSGDGANPRGGLTLSSNTVYGTMINGGTHGYGTVFSINADGSGFTNLHSFFNLHDGANPIAALILSSNRLYGTTQYGGSYGDGAVFAVNTDGTGFTNLHFFRGNDGTTPFGPLTLSGNRLYGTTRYGGALDYGTIFAVNTDGTGFTNLHKFNKSDGSEPQSRLILSGNTLYGTTTTGGSNGNGTVFAINTDGTGFATLYSFTATVGGTNSDGGYPVGGLILSGNTLYGTTHIGGVNGSGTIFSLSFTPQLTLIPSAGNLVFFWPTNYAGFDYSGYTLQFTANLGSSAAWSTSVSPVVANGQYAVTNPMSGAQQFFRLRR